MPYKKPYKRKSRRRKKNWNRVTISRGPITKAITVPLRYCETVIIDPGIAIGTYIFSANNAYDPNYTGVGHQPMGFDQYSTFYNRYTVMKAKMTCNYQVSSGGDKYFIGLALRDTYVGATDTITFREQGDCTYGFLSDIQSAPSQKNLTKWYNAKKQYDVKDAMDIGRLGAYVTAGPTEQNYFHISVGPADGASDEGALICNVTITYWITFSEPKLLAGS